MFQDTSTTSIIIESPKRKKSDSVSKNEFSPPLVLSYQLLVNLFNADMAESMHKHSSQLNLNQDEVAAIIEFENVYYCHKCNDAFVNDVKKLLAKHPNTIIARCLATYSTRAVNTAFKPDKNGGSFLVTYGLLLKAGKEEKPIKHFENSDFPVRVYQPGEQTPIKPLPIPEVSITAVSKPIEPSAIISLPKEEKTIVSPCKGSNPSAHKPLPLPKPSISSPREEKTIVPPHKGSNHSTHKPNLVLKEDEKCVVNNQQQTNPRSKSQPLTAPEKLSHDLVRTILSASYNVKAATKVSTASGLFISHKLPLGNSNHYLQLLDEYPYAVAINIGTDEKRPANTFGEEYESVTTTYALFSNGEEDGIKIERSKFPVVVSKKKDVF